MRAQIEKTYAKEEPLRVYNLQTCFSRDLLRFSVPVAAEGLYKLICVTILKASQPLPIAAAVLQQKNPPALFANSAHLAKRRNGI